MFKNHDVISVNNPNFARHFLALTGFQSLAYNTERYIKRNKYTKSDVVRALSLKVPTHREITHPHPESAAIRQAALTAVRKLCDRLSWKLHILSPGSKEENIADAITRDPYWFRDLLVPQRHDPLTDDTLLYLQDVDYYVDINDVLSTGLPVAIYTIIPSQAAVLEKEYAYRFENSNFHFTCQGGASFSHELWDYDFDTITVERKHGWLEHLVKHWSFPGPKMMTFYEKYEISMPHDRYLIFFIPRYSISSRVAWASLKQPANIIKRRQVNKGPVTIWPSRVKPGYLSLALQGEFNYETLNVKRELMETIRIRIELQGDSFKSSTMSEVARFLVNNKIVDESKSQIAATIMLALYSGAKISTGPDWYSTGNDLDIKTGGQLLHPPLLNHPALLPNRSKKVEQITINERVVGPQNRKVPNQFLGYAKEFVEMTITNPKTGLPKDLIEVLEAQTKPRQKLRHQQKAPWTQKPEYMEALPTGVVPHPVVITAFQKVEPYKDAKPARNISTTPINHQYYLSSFTLSMKEALKEHSWFGPSHTPQEVQEKIENLRTIAPKQKLVCRDFSSFDATVSRWLYVHVVRAMCQRWVASSHEQDFLEAIDAEQNALGYTQHGLCYPLASTRATGSPTTSDHNTIINAFASYASLREMGYQPMTAFYKLGIYYGDDSVDTFPLRYLQIHDQTISALGLKAKTEISHTRDPTPFLGRYFVEGGSFCDPDRTLGKLHLSSSPYKTIEAALNKAVGYISTDRLTPIIGSWARMIIRLAREQGVVFNEDHLLSNEYWRYKQCWPQECDLSEGFFRVCSLSPETAANLENEFEQISDLSQIPTLENPPYKGRQDTVINGELAPDFQDVEIKQNARPQLKQPIGQIGNLCFYQAIRDSANLPYRDGDDLYRHLWTQNVNVQEPGEYVDEEIVMSVSKYLDLDLYVVLSTGGTYHFPGSILTRVYLDVKGHHYTKTTKIEKPIIDYPSTVVLESHSNFQHEQTTINTTQQESVTSQEENSESTSPTDTERTFFSDSGSTVQSSGSKNTKPCNFIYRGFSSSKWNIRGANSSGPNKSKGTQRGRCSLAPRLNVVVRQISPSEVDHRVETSISTAPISGSSVYILRSNNNDNKNLRSKRNTGIVRKPKSQDTKHNRQCNNKGAKQPTQEVGMVSGKHGGCNSNSGSNSDEVDGGYSANKLNRNGSLGNSNSVVRNRTNESNGSKHQPLHFRSTGINPHLDGTITITTRNGRRFAANQRKDGGSLCSNITKQSHGSTRNEPKLKETRTNKHVRFEHNDKQTDNGRGSNKTIQQPVECRNNLLHRRVSPGRGGHRSSIRSSSIVRRGTSRICPSPDTKTKNQEKSNNSTVRTGKQSRAPIPPRSAGGNSPALQTSAGRSGSKNRAQSQSTLPRRNRRSSKCGSDGRRSGGFSWSPAHAIIN
nr:MAG: RNA-dependent RNA polymerase [Wufeng bat nodavirus 1]